MSVAADSSPKGTSMTETKTALYGAMVDLTGVVAAPKKVARGKFADGTAAKKGEKFHGDGRDYRVSFCDADVKVVRCWLKGVQAQAKLFRASVTTGK